MSRHSYHVSSCALAKVTRLIRFCAGYQPGLHRLSARLDLRSKLGRTVTWPKNRHFLAKFANLRIDKNGIHLLAEQ
jgi:hypothetical protein